jgi:hypothetical protein
MRNNKKKWLAVLAKNHNLHNQEEILLKENIPTPLLFSQSRAKCLEAN